MTIKNNNLGYTPENVYNDPVLGPSIVEGYEKVTIHSIKDTKKAFETNFSELYKVLILPDGVRGPEEDRPLIRLLDFGVGSGRLILPFADGLRKQGVDVHVSGIDQSEYMLDALRANLKKIFKGGKFKGEDTFYFKSRDDTTGDGSFSLSLVHGDFNTDKGLDRALEHWLKEKLPFTNSVNLRAIFFVQSWHYVQNRRMVFEKIEEAVDKKDKDKECLLIHFEPLGYLRLLDGDFGSSPEFIQDSHEKIPYGFKPIAGSTWDDQKRRQTMGLHLAFWHEYFAHRNKVYPYSAQAITAVQESVVFQEYRDRGYLEISGSQDPFIARMEQEVDLDYLMDLLDNPRFSAQYVGIDADQRKDIAQKVREMFKKDSEQFKATVDHAYRARVFSVATKKLTKAKTICRAIHLEGFKEETDPSRIVIPSRDAVRSYLRTFLPGVNVLFWGLTAIEAMGGTTSVLLSNMTRKNAWKGFLDKLEERKTVAEYMQDKEIENLMLRLDFNSNDVSRCILEKEDFSPPQWTSEVDREIRDVSELLVKHLKKNEKVLGHFIPKPKEKQRFFYLWYFMLFPRNRIETRFFNVVMTLILDSLPCGFPGTEATAHFLQCVPNMLRAALADVFVAELKKANAEVMQKRHQAAAAAIISRNMSHNIGSHVIPRTGLEDLRKRVQEFHISNDLWSSPDWNWVGFPILKELREKLDGYIQRKSEFIAEFTTDPLISISSAWFYRDIVFPFIRNTALIDTLAANEGFEYRNYDEPGLVIRCFRERDKGTQKEFLPRFSLHWNKADEPEQSKDKWFAVPYGERLAEYSSDTLIPAIKNREFDALVGLPSSVGEMAFFGILENLIRNSAKHGKRRQKNGENARLEVHIVFRDSSTNPDHYEIDIYDNLTDPDGPGEQADETTVELVQRFIEKDIVDETGQCRKEAWGIAEMTLCAELLMGRDPCVDPKPRSLKAKLSPQVKPFLDGSRDRACLTYSFSIIKARTSVFFGFDVDEDEQKKLKRRGFYFENPETLDKWRDDSSDHPLVFQFAVVHASLAKSLLENLSWLPFRVIVVSTDQYSFPKGVAHTTVSPPFIVEEETAKEMRTGNQKGTTDRLTHWLWKIWLEDWGKKKGIESALGLDVYLEQENDQDPTKTWVACAHAFNEIGGEDRTPVVIRVWGNDKKGVLCFTGKGKPRTDERRVIVDRHAKFVSESGYPPGKDDCLLVIDKASNDFDAMFNSRFSSPWQLPYELVEAGLLRILILDERIAQRSLAPFSEIAQAREHFRDAVMRNREVRPTIWNIAERAGIFVATHLAVSGASSEQKKDFLLAEQPWRAAKKEQDSQKRKYEEGGKREPPPRGWRSCPQLALEIDLTKKNVALRSNRFQPLENPHCTTSNGWETEGLPNDLSKDIDLVIVHQGIIDGVNKSFPKGGECFLDAVKKQVPWVVIESGRGIPPQVQKGREKFLSFSVIDRAFHGGRVAKLALTKALMELTRNKAS